MPAVLHFLPDSYTHLDVYKRQQCTVGFLLIILILYLVVAYHASAILGLIIHKDNPVSYTHLP